jgi:hypothetical protein
LEKFEFGGSKKKKQKGLFLGLKMVEIEQICRRIKKIK